MHTTAMIPQIMRDAETLPKARHKLTVCYFEQTPMQMTIAGPLMTTALTERCSC